MKLDEMTGDFIPFDESRTGELARELWRMSEGDLKRAIKMADNYRDLLVFKIKAHAGKMSARRV